ncbi:MAG: aspartate aminotransferase family protein [Chloroflexi bacterium]|nr:aspartate aminotransferase family protein [Chloroflexota bacterium]
MSVSKTLAETQKLVIEAYKQKTGKSRELHKRACESLQAGVSASTRFYPPYPIYMTHAKGSKTYDVDGNEYIDCFLCAGPLILGHNRPEVVEAIKREIDRGLLFSNPEMVIECAELLRELVPCAEKIRLCNTGTEAILAAVRAVRAFTGKDKIIKFYGHYHGLEDQFLVGTTTITNAPTSGGIPKSHVANTVLLRYGDIEAIKRKFDEENDIAAVILDPQMSYEGIWPASVDYLRELRRLTKERGIVLIFDEVITGFRLAAGGAQEYFGIIPDLATFAKGMAAGEKLGAVVGREDIMDTFSPTGFVPPSGVKARAIHGGTFADCTAAVAAGIASLKVYKQLKKTGEYQKLFQLTEKLKAGIEEAFKQRGVPCHVNQLGPSIKIFITDLEPATFETYWKLDKTAISLFYLSMIPEGVWLANPSMRSVFLSFAHTEQDVEQIVAAVNTVLDKYRFEPS